MSHRETLLQIKSEWHLADVQNQIQIKFHKWEAMLQSHFLIQWGPVGCNCRSANNGDTDSWIIAHSAINRTCRCELWKPDCCIMTAVLDGVVDASKYSVLILCCLSNCSKKKSFVTTLFGVCINYDVWPTRSTMYHPFTISCYLSLLPKLNPLWSVLQVSFIAGEQQAFCLGGWNQWRTSNWIQVWQSNLWRGEQRWRFISDQNGQCTSRRYFIAMAAAMTQSRLNTLVCAVFHCLMVNG